VVFDRLFHQAPRCEWMRFIDQYAPAPGIVAERTGTVLSHL